MNDFFNEIYRLFIGLFWEQAAVLPVTPMPVPTVNKPAPIIPTQPIGNDPDVILDWTLVQNARHNVRVICDRIGLTYDQKLRLTACVMQESGFHINAEHVNHDGKGNVLSTDYGICQINDYWHIGPGKDFPSAEYVLKNPEADVSYMAEYYKRTGNLQPWVSWSSGAYLKYYGKV